MGQNEAEVVALLRPLAHGKPCDIDGLACDVQCDRHRTVTVVVRTPIPMEVFIELALDVSIIIDPWPFRLSGADRSRVVTKLGRGLYLHQYTRRSVYHDLTKVDRRGTLHVLQARRVNHRWTDVSIRCETDEVAKLVQLLLRTAPAVRASA